MTWHGMGTGTTREGKGLWEYCTVDIAHSTLFLLASVISMCKCPWAHGKPHVGAQQDAWMDEA